MENDLIAKLALEYRLSLDNLCKLTGKEPSHENKTQIYEYIMSIVHSPDLKLAFEFLFNYETVNENQNSASLAYTKAAVFLRKLKKAQSENNIEEIKKLLKELTRTQDEFNNLKKGTNFSKMTSEESMIVLKYRLKFCISKMKLAESLGVSTDLLSRKEESIENPVLRQKFILLSDFYEDLYLRNKKTRR